MCYIHMGFGSLYKEEVHVKIEQGIVVASAVQDNRKERHDPVQLGWHNLPGLENRFQGDNAL